MDIEELTKSQIFLLTLLTSFVTSMATGIATVALMDQGPLTITQSVSRVVQSTIEKPSEPDKKSQPVAAAVAVPLQPVPVASEPEKENTLAAVVQSVLPAVVRLYDTNGALIGFGTLLDRDGTIVSDYSLFGTTRKYVTVALQSGATLKAGVFANDAKNGLIFLSPTSATTSPAAAVALAEQKPAIGDSVVGIFGKNAPRIASGLIVALSSPDQSGASIMTTDLDPALIPSGAPIIDMNGALVGLSSAVSRSVDGASFTPASLIAAEYEIALKTKATAAAEALTR